MTTVAVVPVKPLRRGKSRLADVLSVQERTQLNRYLFTHTLEVLQQVPEIERTLVVSRDSAALALAREYGAHTLQEQGNSQLNLALKRATMLLRSSAVATILVLPADLPLLTAEDVRALLASRPRPRGVALAPSENGQGTNGLALSPLGAMEYAYGPHSFPRHLALAREAGLPVAVVTREGLARDLDWPQDLSLVATAFPEFSARGALHTASAAATRLPADAPEAPGLPAPYPSREGL